jgi:hypothetical protein
MNIYTLLMLAKITCFSLEQKLCRNCKHFIRDIESDIKFGKCAQFINEYKSVYHLIDGIDDRKTVHHYCSVARKIDSMCGETAKYYEANQNITVLLPDNQASFPSRKWFLW